MRFWPEFINEACYHRLSGDIMVAAKPFTKHSTKNVYRLIRSSFGTIDPESP